MGPERYSRNLERIKILSLGGKSMKLKEIAERLGWELKTPNVPMEMEVKTGYASDLFSDVLANSIEGDLWMTRQTHLNIVAIAVMRDLSGILLVSGPSRTRIRWQRRRKIRSDFPDPLPLPKSWGDFISSAFRKRSEMLELSCISWTSSRTP